MVAAQTGRVAIICATVLLSTCSFGQQADVSDSESSQLANQLADPQPQVRRQAFEALRAKGIDAFDALYPLRKTKSLEQRLAVRRLLQLIEIDWTNYEISEPLLQILVDYRRQSVVRRKVLLERIELSDQPGTVVVLANLSRYERSQHLSCQAAICLIRHCSNRESRSQLALDTVGTSQRKSCVWIRDALESGPASDFAEHWMLHLQNELYVRPQEAKPWRTEIMFQLLEWSLPQFIARDQWPASDNISLQCAQTCPVSLISNFADLFIRLNCWKALDELVDQYAHEFNTQPLLLYRVAYAKLLQGQPDSAHRWIKRAGQIEQTPQNQLESGIALQQLGYSSIAEQVLRLLSLRSDCPMTTRIRSNLILAQWFHQDDQNAKASHRIDLILNQLESQEFEPSIFQQLGCSQEQVVSRQCLYKALDCLANNDLIGCESNILEGLHVDPHQVDLLILGNRCQFFDRDTIDLVQDLIQLRQQELKDQIAELKTLELGMRENTRKSSGSQLELAALANRYAWLTANTAGDTENALRHARLANELVDRNPYYIDTEAKCYFVLGDVRRAIALQTEACRLARHDVSIQKQLRSFQRFEGMTPIAKIPGQRR